MLAVMDNYCRGHPLDTVETAAESLMAKLVMQKFDHSPKR
jgi:hypothetical protein